MSHIFTYNGFQVNLWDKPFVALDGKTIKFFQSSKGIPTVLTLHDDEEARFVMSSVIGQFSRLHSQEEVAAHREQQYGP